MLITGRKIVDNIKSSEFMKVNQVGIDLSVANIEQIIGGVMVLKDKTIVNPEFFSPVPTTNVDGYEGWRLIPGAYAITFNEGVKIPSNRTGFIQSRSSIYRGGSLISSPVWDPGFETEIMGTTMVVNCVIFIEKNARIGQFIMHESHEPDELYNGQFQSKTNY